MIERMYKPSPGYAGVSLSLAKTELNVCGLHRTDGLRLKPFFYFFFYFNLNYFVHISSSWVEMSLHTKFQLPRLPGRRTTRLRLNPIGGGGCCHVT